jgi:hypothetical protein
MYFPSPAAHWQDQTYSSAWWDGQCQAPSHILPMPPNSTPLWLRLRLDAAAHLPDWVNLSMCQAGRRHAASHFVPSLVNATPL